MRTRILWIGTLVALVVGLALASTPVLAAAKPFRCHMSFSLKGWSLFYKTASGTGEVICDNGQKMRVRLTIKGGGLTFGKSSIHGGKGVFSGVYNIHEVLGGYVMASAHAGAVRSAQAMVLTKGEVSLALSGLGRGWDLGVDFGEFRISPLK